LEYSLSTSLIKSSSNKEFPIASVHNQVAWILTGSLMCLGLNFATAAVAVTGKTALPKVPAKEGYANRSEIEWEFMFHVRECILAVSYYIVEIGVAKRLTALLLNTLSFISLVPPAFLPRIPHLRFLYPIELKCFNVAFSGH